MAKLKATVPMPFVLSIYLKCFWRHCFCLFLLFVTLLLIFANFNGTVKLIVWNLELESRCDKKSGAATRSLFKPSSVFQFGSTKSVRIPFANLSKPYYKWCPSGDFGDTYEIDCNAILNGEDEFVEDAKYWLNPCETTDAQVYNVSQDCEKLHQSYPFVFDHKFDPEFEKFPLAYVLVVEKHADQVLKLLQAIYRPQNLYCITYDSHSDSNFKLSMQNLAKCYPENILMPANHHEINWGGFSILEANMKCLRLLNAHQNEWKYVQMLSWNDFPLKTNEEMVNIFKILNGSNDSELKDGEPYRYVRYFNENSFDASKQNLNKPIPPGDLYVYKGSLASSLTREFIDFALTNEIAQQYYEYSRSTLIPEEQFWATLIHNQHIKAPGSFPGMCKHYFWYRWKKKKPWISRYQMWSYLGDSCEGLWTHKSCVYGVGDLWSLSSRPELMAHKIYITYQPATLYCLTQLHFNRTYLGRRELMMDKLDYSYYKSLPSVLYQNMMDKTQFNCLGDFWNRTEEEPIEI